MAPKEVKPSSGSTTAAGAPAESDRNSLSVGSNGPLLLHDVHLVETLAQFNRERVPERNPHAKGAGAFGVLEVTEDERAAVSALVREKMETAFPLEVPLVVELGSGRTWGAAH